MQKRIKASSNNNGVEVDSLFLQCERMICRLHKSCLREFAGMAYGLPPRITDLLFPIFKYFGCKGRLEGLMAIPCGRCPGATPGHSESVVECNKLIMKKTTNHCGRIEDCSLFYDKAGERINVCIEQKNILKCKMFFSILVDISKEDLGFGRQSIANAKGLFLDFMLDPLLFPDQYYCNTKPDSEWCPLHVDVESWENGEWEINLHGGIRRPAIWCKLTIDIEDLKTFIQLSLA